MARPGGRADGRTDGEYFGVPVTASVVGRYAVFPGPHRTQRVDVSTGAVSERPSTGLQFWANDVFMADADNGIASYNASVCPDGKESCVEVVGAAITHDAGATWTLETMRA